MTEPLTLAQRLRNRNYAKSPTFAAAYMNEAADELDRLSAELAEARKREDRLQEFAKWAIREGAFQAADLDGLSIQEKAHELGLIEATTYNSEKHGPSDCAEDGDEWFVFSRSLSPAQPEAKESRDGR